MRFAGFFDIFSLRFFGKYSKTRHIRRIGDQKVLLEYIKNCFDTKKPLEDGIHRKAMLWFEQYMLVGGMPQSVSKYLEGSRNFVAADLQKRDILALYMDDIGKAKVKYRTKIKSVFHQIPAFLSMHEKRVRLSGFSNGDYLSFQDTFFWLENSMMVNQCYVCLDPNVGLALNEDSSALKCYMGDTGLLVSLAFNEKELADGELYKTILNGNLSVNKGMLYENAIAQCLTANGYDLFYYTSYNAEKHRNDIEIDFIISNGSKLKPKIYPIEVKSTKRYQTKSLDRFIEKFSQRIGCAYIIHPANLKVEDRKIYLPAYMAFCL